MPQTPMIFGIPMLSKTSRRWLVIFCYGAFSILLLLFFIATSSTARLLLTICVVMAANSVQFVIFYKLAKDLVLPVSVKEDMRPINLGLVRSERSDKIKPDERQVAVRNAAYFKAYRIVAVYLLLMPIIFLSLISSNKILLAIFIWLTYTVIFTLPQAIVLWTEPDIPVEAI